MVFTVPEQTTQKYTGTLKDENGAAIPGSALTTLTLTLYEASTHQIINSRNAQNVLNLNGVTVDSNGVLTWIMAPADNAHLGQAQRELHVALFEWTYDSGKRGQHEASFYIQDTPFAP